MNLKKMEMPDTIAMVLTSNDCEKHVKPVQMMMVDGVEICPACQLKKEHEEVQAQMQQAVLKTEKRRKEHRLLNDSIIVDRTVVKANFENFVAVTEEEKQQKLLAQQAVEKYAAGEAFTLFMQGGPGVGKSHLAMSILKKLNDGGNRICLFINMREMMMRIRHSISNPTSPYNQMYFIQLLSSADIVCLDDVGAETGSIETTREASNYTLEILTSILEARLNQPTIITTNLNRERLEKMYDKKLISRLLHQVSLVLFSTTTDKRISRYEK